MDCSIPGFAVQHQLPEPTEINVHRVGDAIQPSVVPFSSCLQSSQATVSFLVSQFFTSGGQSNHSESLETWKPQRYSCSCFSHSEMKLGVILKIKKEK